MYRPKPCSRRANINAVEWWVRSLRLGLVATAATLAVAAGAALHAATGFALPEAANLSAIPVFDPEYFGYSVAVDGETAVVGSNRPEISLQGAFVFTRNQGGSGAWGGVKELERAVFSNSDRFGHAIAIDGDTIVVGAPLGNAPGDFRTGAAHVFERNAGGPGNWGEVQKLTASDARAGDSFGWSASISGDTIVVGAQANGPGAAYVFERNHGGADNWGQVTQLAGSDPSTSGFGRSLALDDSALVVGAAFTDGHPDCANLNCNSGAVYVFARNEGGAENWGELEMLLPSDTAPGDVFGAHVAIRGDHIVAGARGKQAVYVFARDQGALDSWGEVQKLTSIDADVLPSPATVSFPSSLAISRGRVIVGTDGGFSHPGAAYVFERNLGGADAWGHAQKLRASTTEHADFFGASVAISGQTTIVGAPRSDDHTADGGAAYVFVVTADGSPASSPLVPEPVLSTVAGPSSPDLYGASTALSNDLLLVGAPEEDGGAGAAYLYQRNQGGEDEWGLVRRLTGTATVDRFGSAVAIDGDTLVVGVPRADDAAACGDGSCDSGSAYVFARHFNNWGLVTRIEAADADVGDRFGSAVSIDKHWIVVGAPGDDDATECVDITCDSGSVYLFERNFDPATPTLPVADFWGERKKLAGSAASQLERLGTSVSIEGDTLVAGAPGDPSSEAGRAYVFFRNSGSADAWQEIAMMTATEGSPGDELGTAIDISHGRVVVGAPGNQANVGADAGAVFLFGRNQGGVDAWGQITMISPLDASGENQLGTAVAIDGDLVAAGSRWDYEGGEQSGAVWLFERNVGGADGWGQLAKLTSMISVLGDTYGASVAISDGRVAAGASRGLLEEQGFEGQPGFLDLFEYRHAETDLRVTKDDSVIAAWPGQELVYDIRVENAGPAPLDVSVFDPFPPETTGCTWLCVPTGATCGASGQGSELADAPNLPPSTAVTYQVSCTVSGDALGEVSNTVIALSTTPSVLDADPTNNLANDVTSLPAEGTCGGMAQDLGLQGQTHASQIDFRACDTVTVGQAFDAEPGADVGVCAGTSVAIAPNTSIASGAVLRVTVAADPTTCPG